MSLNIFLYISKQSYSFHVDYSPQMEEPSRFVKMFIENHVAKGKKKIYTCASLLL